METTSARQMSSTRASRIQIDVPVSFYLLGTFSTQSQVETLPGLVRKARTEGRDNGKFEKVRTVGRSARDIRLLLP